MTNPLPPVCAACMGLFHEIGWIIYDGGLLVHADRGECERYAQRKGKTPTVWHGPPDPEAPVLNGACHYCGKNAAGSKYHTRIYGREFCHLSCAEGWREQRRLDRIEKDKLLELDERFGIARTRPRY